MDLASILLFLAVGLLEIASVWLVNRRLQFEHDFMVSRGTLGEQLGEYLMAPNSEEEGAPTNLTALASHFAKEMHQIGRFSDMQEKSVESRILNKYDDAIHEGLKAKIPFPYKTLMKAAEYFGLNLDEIIDKGELQAFVLSLSKHGGVPIIGTQQGTHL